MHLQKYKTNHPLYNKYDYLQREIKRSYSAVVKLLFMKCEHGNRAADVEAKFLIHLCNFIYIYIINIK